LFENIYVLAYYSKQGEFHKSSLKDYLKRNLATKADSWEILYADKNPYLVEKLSTELAKKRDYNNNFVKDRCKVMYEVKDILNIMIIKAHVTLQKNPKGYSWIVEQCPFCGKKHVHGGGSLDSSPDDFLGWRVPHCS